MEPASKESKSAHCDKEQVLSKPPYMNRLVGRLMRLGSRPLQRLEARTTTTSTTTATQTSATAKKTGGPGDFTNLTVDFLNEARYRPIDIDTMVAETGFDKREVRSLYRAFKQDCPNGIIDVETFKEVYDKIFPLGDTALYSNLVFGAIDRERSGGISFGDFMTFLSAVTKGEVGTKLHWAFRLIDLNHDDVITMDEMLKVNESVHQLMGSTTVASSVVRHVERVFVDMDGDNDGVVSKDDFVNYCLTHPTLMQSLTVIMQKVLP